MRKEVINFYKDKGIPMSLMIDKRRHNTTPEQVEEAAVNLYDEIQDGFKIEDREMPRYIFRKAVGLRSDKYKKERIKIRNYDKKVLLLAKAYKKTNAELKRIKSSQSEKERKQTRFFFISVWSITMTYSILKLAGILL